MTVVGYGLLTTKIFKSSKQGLGVNAGVSYIDGRLEISDQNGSMGRLSVLKNLEWHSNSA